MLALIKLQGMGIPVQFVSYDPVNLRNGRDFLAYGTGEEKGQADLVLFNFLYNLSAASYLVRHPKSVEYQFNLENFRPDDIDRYAEDFYGLSPRLPFREDLADGAFWPSIAAVGARVAVVFGRCDDLARDVNIHHATHEEYIQIGQVVESQDFDVLPKKNKEAHSGARVAYAMIHRDYAENLVAFYKERGIFAPIVPLLDVAPARAENPDYTPMGKGLTLA